jgi:hypothetical protein
MSETAPPAVGQDPWGDHLNSYLMQLEERIVASEESIVALAALEARIVALEAQKEYVYNSFAWQFSSSPPPATGNQLRLNNPSPLLATVLDFRRIDSDGADRTPIFQQLGVGDTIRITDWNDASQLYRYKVTGSASFSVDNVTVPVSWFDGAGVVPNAKVNVGFLAAIEV